MFIVISDESLHAEHTPQAVKHIVSHPIRDLHVVVMVTIEMEMEHNHSADHG